MSLLLQIQKAIDVANSRVARLEMALRDNPGYSSIVANLDSAVRIRKKLEEQFAEAAAAIGVEVCRYRAFDDNDRPIAGAAFGAVAAFQRLVSVVFGCKKYGKKQKAHIDVTLERETALGLAYAFTGSVGVVLTIRSDADLFGESFFDEAMQAVFEMAKSRDPAVIQQFANGLGAAAINALYSWVRANTDHDLGAELEWKHGNNTKRQMLLQRQELLQLRTAIEKTSSESTESLRSSGLLQMADVGRRRFKLKRDGLPEIRGTFEPGAIDDEHKVALPAIYTVDLRVTTTLQYSTGAEKKKYHLLRLHQTEQNGETTQSGLAEGEKNDSA